MTSFSRDSSDLTGHLGMWYANSEVPMWEHQVLISTCPDTWYAQKYWCISLKWWYDIAQFIRSFQQLRAQFDFVSETMTSFTTVLHPAWRRRNIFQALNSYKSGENWTLKLRCFFLPTNFLIQPYSLVQKDPEYPAFVLKIISSVLQTEHSEVSSQRGSLSSRAHSLTQNLNSLFNLHK